MSALEPCPHCGGVDIRKGHVRDGSSLRCANCGASFIEYHGPPDNTAEDRLFRKWNTRTASPRIAELEAENDRLREALTEIASLTQSTKLLWWQKLARAALAPKETDE